MRRSVVPRNSSVHRFAILALYRALLRQCRTLPNTIPESSTIKHLIPIRFHRYKKIDSPSQINNALKAGYEALDLLHSASQGNQNDVHRVSAVIAESATLRKRDSPLQRAIAEAKLAIPKSPKRIRAEEAIRYQEMTSKRHPDAIPILSRPRPVVGGKRRIPHFVNAGGIPMLRTKKPQPGFLSAIIRSKLKQRQRWFDRGEGLRVDMTFGKDEDDWDRMTVPQDGKSWASEAWESMQMLKAKIRERDTKNYELAEAMWQVVVRERELAAKENQQKSAEK